MTEEQIKQKAEAEADKVIIGSGMDRASVIHLKHLLVTMYIQGATEATKELKAQIENMKCCGNCKYRELIKEHGQWKERLNCKGNGCVLHSKWVMRNF